MCNFWWQFSSQDLLIIILWIDFFQDMHHKAQRIRKIRDLDLFVQVAPLPPNMKVPEAPLPPLGRETFSILFFSPYLDVPGSY